jgi:hypothetical protein
VSDAQLGQVERALLEGATANGFTGELWTQDRIALMPGSDPKPPGLCHVC